MLDTATEKEIAHERDYWIEAGLHFWFESSRESAVVKEMCAEGNGWTEGKQFKVMNGITMVNPKAMREAQIEALNEGKLDIARKPTALYRHYDESGALLYVGISLNPIRRLQQHEKSAWCDSIATIKIERFAHRREAIEAEERAIKAESPLHNIKFNEPCG